MPKTKIIATLGPASSSETVIRKMMLAGLDVARLNFSHGDTSAHQRRLDIVRKLNRKYRRRVKILQDLIIGTATIFVKMKRWGLRLGLVPLCVGGGHGVAVSVEPLESFTLLS